MTTGKTIALTRPTLVGKVMSLLLSNLYSILTHICGIQKDDNDNLVCETAKETQMYRTDIWTLGEGEGGMIWENGIETCKLSHVK